MDEQSVKSVETAALRIAYVEHGPTNGWPVILSHGFPYEDLLAQKPTVKVPTVTIDGATDPLKPGGTAGHARMFVGLHEHRVLDAGHNLPQQAPQPFADAVIKVRDWFLQKSRRMG